MEPVLNPNFTFLRDRLPHLRVAALQGGTRSGKTYSALQYLIDLADTYSGMVLSIVRESYPALRATVLRDFIEIMDDAGLFNPSNESKPQGYYEYEHNGNLFEFFSVDNEQKVRGRKRDILYANEGNEITLHKWRQLMFRTTGRAIVDFNPSDADSYIYDHVIPRADCETLITTYRDNPHLPQEIIDEIELLEHADPEYWKVFGEGQRGNVSGAVLGHYKVIAKEAMPVAGQTVYGLDFGYSAPSALVRCTTYDEAYYWQELLYKRKLTNPELIAAVKLLIPLNATIYADAAEPDRIQEFKNAGFTNIHAAVKNVKDGIDLLRSKRLFISDDSPNLLNEVKQYRYAKDRDGNLLEEPLAINGDHAIDAGRYGFFSHARLIKPQHTAFRPAAKKGKF